MNFFIGDEVVVNAYKFVASEGDEWVVTLLKKNNVVVVKNKKTSLHYEVPVEFIELKNPLERIYQFL